MGITVAFCLNETEIFLRNGLNGFATQSRNLVLTKVACAFSLNESEVPGEIDYGDAQRSYLQRRFQLVISLTSSEIPHWGGIRGFVANPSRLLQTIIVVAFITKRGRGHPGDWIKLLRNEAA